MKHQSTITTIYTILRKAKVSPQQVRYIFKQVRLLGGYATPKRPRKLPEYLTDPEIDHLLTNAIKSDPTTATIPRVAIFTGVRSQELCDLQIQDIDLYNRQLKVVKGKGGKDRIVPLSTGLMQHLHVFIAGKQRGHLFTTSTGRKYSARGMQDKIKRLLESCHFSKHLSTHSLRHTFGTLLRRRGMALEKIQILMGHSSIRTTEIYAHIELGPVKEEFIRMLGWE